MVVLKRYPNSMSANIAKSILEDSGIDAFVADETLANADPPVVFASGGLRLMVAEHDYERAVKVLAERETGFELPDDFDPGERGDSEPAEMPSTDSQTVRPGSLLLGSNGLSTLLVALISLIAGALLMLLYLKHTRSPLASEADTAYDTNGDGRTDQTFKFASDGSYEYQVDGDFDGEMDSVYIYDENSALVSGKVDRDFDGRFETRIQIEDGIEAHESDRDGDGNADMIERYKNNNLVSTEWLQQGKVWKKSSFDPFQKVRDEIDRDRDGTFDATITFGEGEEPE